MNEMQDMKNMVGALKAIWYDETSLHGSYKFTVPLKGIVSFYTLEDAIAAYFQYEKEIHDESDDWDGAEFEANKALALNL